VTADQFAGATGIQDLQTSPWRVHNLLRTGIRDGLYPPGHIFDEARLGRELGSSRNSVRQALQMLAQERLVVRERGRGTVVTGAMIDIKLGDLMPDGSRPPLRPVRRDVPGRGLRPGDGGTARDRHRQPHPAV
jgi:DNA-binding transcriptional MocR family regulator